MEGMSTKLHIVKSFVSENAGSPNGDLLHVLCQLHAMRCITIQTAKVWSAVTFQQAGTSTASAPMSEASNPGFFLVNAMVKCDSSSDLAKIVNAYIASNAGLDQVALLQYINNKGFVKYDEAAVSGVVAWSAPEDEGNLRAGWRELWGHDPMPEGRPWYATLRDDRGVRTKLAFLGSVTDDGTAPALLSPSAIMVRKWKALAPSLCISVDAGSMHPKLCDTIDRMANLPQFYEWVLDRDPNARAAAVSQFRQSSTQPTPGGREGAGVTAPAEEGKQMAPASTKGIAAWQEFLPDVPMDAVLGDGSINNVIFTKLKEVFSALLDAAKLAEQWIVIDRTAGKGSATAELLIEMALARGAQKPTILVIDSLERLGTARTGSNSHRVLKQLHDIFMRREEGFVTQEPSDTDPDAVFDYRYSIDEYDNPFGQDDRFQHVEDHGLPFAVLADHIRKREGTCDPKRRWRYFYMDGLFRSATHMVIKNNDLDVFDVEEVAGQGFLYAHGDTRTYRRLRSNIQQGKPTVMLHNSGGVVTAFSWLQRVMKHQRPPPRTADLQAPLQYIISNLSTANWTLDFGVPEILMMRSLAERAPMLFRNSVISVDLMEQSEEEVLEAITGCFSQPGGVPELGLGNAEVNVLFNTWMLHLTLCENARSFQRLSIATQWIIWLLGLGATFVAVLDSSLGSGILASQLGLVRRLHEELGVEPTDGTPPMSSLAVTIAELQVYLNYVVVIVPIVLALVVTINSRMKWRDKWSVCIMAADSLASEIYKFRMQTCEYDQSKPPGKDENGNELPPLSVKEKNRRARMLFVERVQAFQQACFTELAQSSSLRLARALRPTKRVHPTQLFLARQFKEEKPTLAQWWKLKLHLEKHFYRSAWAFPLGVSFLSWFSALRPYLNQKTMKEELKSVVMQLAEEDRINLRGAAPLSDAETRLVRRTLAASLGLPKSLFDAVQGEIRVLQRTVVIEIADEIAKKAAEARSSGGSGRKTMIKALISPEELAERARERGEKTRGAPPVRMSMDASADSSGESNEEKKMRELIMDMQGFGKPSEEDGEAVRSIKKRQKKMLKDNNRRRQIDDDYLAGPLTVDSYICYRVRPAMEMLQRRSGKLAWRLATLEVIMFMFQASGSIFAIFKYTEWVAVTISIAVLIQSFIGFTALTDQVTSVNLALRDLSKLIVFWDALSIVRRRTPAVKHQVVAATEQTLLMVVESHTTAASNTIASVSKQLEEEQARADEEEEGGS